MPLPWSISARRPGVPGNGVESIPLNSDPSGSRPRPRWDKAVTLSSSAYGGATGAGFVGAVRYGVAVLARARIPIFTPGPMGWICCLVIVIAIVVVVIIAAASKDKGGGGPGGNAPVGPPPGPPPGYPPPQAGYQGYPPQGYPPH